jgi:RimJ/RimL family protein N-acetyltransferase
MEHEVNSLGQRIGLPIAEWQPPPRPERPTLRGRTCSLEPLSAARHAATLHAANSADAEGRMWTYMPYGPFPTFADYRGWTENAEHSTDPIFMTIMDSATGRPAGIASYLRIDPPNGAIEVGHIALSPSLQRTVAATEAMYLLMSWAFSSGYRRYEWKCNALNAASRRAAMRLGLSYEGVFRQAAVVKGRNRDTAWYAAVDADWPALKRAFERWLDPENFDGAGGQRLSLAALTDPILVARG